MEALSKETLSRLRLLVAGQGDTRLVAQAIQKFGTANAAIDAPGLRTRLRVGLTDTALETVDAEVAAALALGARFTQPGQSDFPTSLIELNPVMLSVVGQWPQGPAVAIVGSRDADDYGLSIAAELGAALAQSGIAVVSGGAHGIDAAALHAAMDAGGYTATFLGFGLSHRAATVPDDLLNRALSEGTVVSEYLPTARGSKTSYLERNRLIAAFADVVVVVQARTKSGSLNTARHANRLSTPVYAVPGDVGIPLSEGVNRLIATGKAKMLTHISEFARIFDRPELSRAQWPVRSRSPSVKSHTPSQLDLKITDRILTEIERCGGAAHRTELANALGVALADIDETLMELELEGHLGRDAAGRYMARTARG